MPEDEFCRLTCVIEGDSVAFPVTVGRGYLIAHLKKVIQTERAMDVLKDTDPHTLELWKVSTYLAV